MKPASIKDIASKANVSITTVSFILNGKAEQMRISAGVIQKVEAIIKELEFKPNQVARSLRTGNTKTIGLIVEDISNPFFAGIARKIEDKAYKKGYKISYSSTENEVLKAKDLIEMFKSRQVDAYIIAPIPGIEEDIKQLQDEGIPVVLFDRNLPTMDINYVVVDNFNGTYIASKHLIDKGKRNIAFVTVGLHVDEMDNRFLGYKKALADHNIPFNTEVYEEIEFNSTEEETVKRLSAFFTAKSNIDAVIFSTNYLAINGLLALKAINKKIGDDFSFISYDDHDLFRLHTPPISVVDQPIEEIAERVIGIVLQELAANTAAGKKEKAARSEVTLQPKFIER
ncbi:MAG: LacI family transcriptional regulator [Pedobacter sp.]|nr:MAG: LacI family transcriptional regulator [Pedobacter sp.]